MSSTGSGLKVEGITVRYGGVTANDDVSLEVRPGEIVGLIGPNGAGKTTLVDAITGFAPAVGHVGVDGQSVDRLRPYQRRRQGLSRTWQGAELFSGMTVVQNLSIAVDAGGMKGVWADLFRRQQATNESVLKALDSVGLSALADSYPDNLSLGQLRLIGVAQALAGKPRILLLDEPAAGLDSRESVRLGAIIQGISALGIGVLLVEHDMRLVFDICHRVCVLEFGHLIAEGAAEEVRNLPAVRSAYLGEPI